MGEADSGEDGGESDIRPELDASSNVPDMGSLAESWLPSSYSARRSISNTSQKRRRTSKLNLAPFHLLQQHRKRRFLHKIESLKHSPENQRE
jgi:hypothetical protein